MNKDYAYDIETYPNFFSCVVKHVTEPIRLIFEISEWVDNSAQLYAFLMDLRRYDCRMVGFNNFSFDYVVLHEFISTYQTQGSVSAWQLYMKAQQIIGSQQDDNRFGLTIWEPLIKQVDLFKIHHFDNRAKSTSLKELEFNMRSWNVADLPIPVGTVITHDQRETVLTYNCHDVDETVRFYHRSIDAIKFRDELTAQYLGKDFTNFNDTKIGKEYLIMKLEEAAPGSCYVPGTKRPQQTHRPDGIRLSDIIFPYIQFQQPEFTRVLEYLRGVTIRDTKGTQELKDLSATVRGLQFDYGTGGLHGSIKGTVVRANETHTIIDVDVASMYPNIAIKNRVYPHHLGETFCDIYAGLYEERKQHPKGSAPNAMLKLGLNGVYGDSNNIYSPFYDPAYTMTITINGQLLLSKLAEMIMNVPHAEIIQANTDGITTYLPRSRLEQFREACKEWEKLTHLTLEEQEYSMMAIRDVNNYLSVTANGKIKRKGAYQWNTDHPNDPSQSLQWHQDWSALVAPMAAEAFLTRGVPVESFIAEHRDPFDFMLRAKVPRSSRLQFTDGTPINANIVRYVITHDGPGLVKVMPPLPKAPGKERVISIDAGWSVHICNDIRDFDWSRLNRMYYVELARKLIECFTQRV